MSTHSQDDHDPQSPTLTNNNNDNDAAADEHNCSFKSGSIHRVRLKNFLTYSDVEFRPGPRLNVVIGPNGTGKSTILCAICLGLGGQPPLLGRADDARTFIMHEKDMAEIEIELYPKNDSPEVHIIKRVIDRNKGSDRGKGAGASTFYINDVMSTLKKVKALVEDYDIAVDNLCTFLPQDRVGSFSGFDAKQLLQETEKSLSGTKHLYQQHLALIDLEKEISSSGSNVSSVEERLKQLQEDNERLEREKELMEERKQHEQKLELLEQKKAWLEFDLVRMRALELKEERTKIDSTLKEFRGTLQPLREQCAEFQLKVNKSKSKVKQIEKAIQNAKTGYETGQRSAERCQDDIESQLNNFTSIDAMQRQSLQNVKKMEEKVKIVEAEVNEYPPEEQLKERHHQATEELRKLKTQLNRAKHELSSKQNQLKDKQDMKQHLVDKLGRMKDDKARRNERIFRQFPKLHEAHQWLEQNRKMFRRPVWGPIVCEIVTKDEKVASFLEQHVANTILKAFVVECDEDYNLLYRETRQKRNIPINVIKVPQGKLNEVHRLYSKNKMSILKKEHGVLGYLDEMISVPDAVLEALRNTSSIHSVLVGSSKTQESIDRRNLLDLLSQSEDGTSKLRGSCVITSHLNRSYKYTTIVSRYSSKSSLRVDEINAARMLKPGVSQQEKEKVESDIQKVDKELSELLPGVEEATKLYNEFLKEGQKVTQETKDATRAKTELQQIKSKLKTALKKLDDAKAEAQKDYVAEKQGILTKLRNYASKYISNLETSSDQYTQYMENTSKYAVVKMSEDGLLQSLQKIADILSERESETSHLEASLKSISLKFKEAKHEMKQLKHYADQIAPIKDAEGNELPLRAKLAELPEHISEIEALIEDANTKIQSIHDNPEALRRYEEQKLEIEKIKNELDGLQDAEDARRDQLKNLREPWENALLNMIEKVNVKFSAYMRELKYAGEIVLSRGDDVDNGRSSKGNNEVNLGNFREWGIKIRVKFRGNSDLQTLSAQVHSGGERSVSTIMYLMALQDLMVSPFRCVDEINQGLDERNERFVFKRIVENSTSTRENWGSSNHSGQYFLITPKLLPNLTDMEHPDVTILCIFNGPFNFSHFSDWDVNSFLSGKKRNRVGEMKEVKTANRRKRLKD